MGRPAQRLNYIPGPLNPLRHLKLHQSLRLNTTGFHRMIPATREGKQQHLRQQRWKLHPHLRATLIFSTLAQRSRKGAATKSPPPAKPGQMANATVVKAALLPKKRECRQNAHPRTCPQKRNLMIGQTTNKLR